MLYTIGDLHLSLGCDKPMDIFAGWSNYLERLETNWFCWATIPGRSDWKRARRTWSTSIQG